MAWYIYKSICIAAMWAATVSVSSAQGTEKWVGTMKSAEGKRLRVVATVSASKISLHFEEPASCKVAATVLDVENVTKIYCFGVAVNGGSYCDGLHLKELLVTPSDEGALHMRFQRGSTSWSGSLERLVDP
jgi:hypothetical protein